MFKSLGEDQQDDELAKSEQQFNSKEQTIESNKENNEEQNNKDD